MASTTDAFDPGDLGLDKVRNVDDLVRAGRQAPSVLAFLRKMGFWTGHGDKPVVEPFPRSFSELGIDKIGDLSAEWQSELSRVTEILGVIEAEIIAQRRAVKELRAQKSRDEWASAREDKVRITKGEIEDRVSADPAVMAAEQQLTKYELARTALERIRESYEGKRNTISREITRATNLP